MVPARDEAQTLPARVDSLMNRAHPGEPPRTPDNDDTFVGWSAGLATAPFGLDAGDLIGDAGFHGLRRDAESL